MLNTFSRTCLKETQGQVSVSSHTKYHTFPDSGQSLQLAKWRSHTLQFNQVPEGCQDCLAITSILRIPFYQEQEPIPPFPPTSDLRLQTSDFRLHPSDLTPQTSTFRLQTSDFIPQPSDFRHPTTCLYFRSVYTLSLSWCQWPVPLAFLFLRISHNPPLAWICLYHHPKG